MLSMTTLTLESKTKYSPTLNATRTGLATSGLRGRASLVLQLELVSIISTHGTSGIVVVGQSVLDVRDYSQEHLVYVVVQLGRGLKEGHVVELPGEITTLLYRYHLRSKMRQACK